LPFDRPLPAAENVVMTEMCIVQIPCLADNYCVLLHAPGRDETLAIDAPEAAPIEAALRQRNWRLSEILVTHHHGDHTGGCRALTEAYNCRITGPEAEADRVPGLTRAVHEGSVLSFAGLEVRVLETPGHTLGHVSYYIPGISTVFTGDTLFAMGCGRIFEGDAQTMYASLRKIAALPADTQIYCGHEYTLANARFALSVEPENPQLVERVKEIETRRAAGQATLPSSVALETATNPFLRSHSAAIRARLGLVGAPNWQVFARLRELKNKA
jgi:hydroxyacylglutathione hydrolase